LHFGFSPAAIAKNDDAAVKIVIKLSDVFDISNDFYDTCQLKNRAMIHFSIGIQVE
jgi:hypothetical protein